MTFDKNIEAFINRVGASRLVKWYVLGGITLLFTVFLYPNLISTQHSYKPGDVAERNIKAPKDFLVEDKEATEEKRRQNVDAVLTVYDHNESLLAQITARVAQAFEKIRKIYQEADLKTALPADEIQGATPAEDKSEVLHHKIIEEKDEFEEALGISVSKGAYGVLEREGFHESVPRLIIQILSEILSRGVVANKEILLKESGKGIALRSVGSGNERVFYKLKQFYGPDQSKIMVRVIGQPLLKDYNYILKHLIVDFAQRLIQPNITLNTSETEARKKLAANEITQILYEIKAGMMLLREGEIVTQTQLLKLNALQRQIKKEQILISTMGAAAIVMCLLIIIYTLKLKQQDKDLLTHNKNLVFMACILVIFVFVAKIASALPGSLAQGSVFSIPYSSFYYGVPIAAGTMIICIFMGLDVAVAVALVMAVCSAIIFQKRLDLFIYFLLSGIMAAYWIEDCRERKVFIKAGFKLGCLNVILAWAIDIYLVDFTGSKLLWDGALAFLGGMATGIVTAGVAPLIEVTFNYSTDIKLLELANLERPILRRLMITAPGTYHHSVIVGSMVEAAASDIGANPLLSKVCGYYHDIGKINKPLYFIENQANGKNKHDKLAPNMSKRILLSHVKDGVEIARQNKLGTAITDTICQSHGTSIVTYFYEKAKQLSKAKSINADDYRYPGPKPQTKEAGLVMLADVTEAASRTLTNPTPSRIKGLVNELINDVFSDGQLDNCELTLKDLHNIANSFIKILNAIHHHRIEYSEHPAAKNGVDKNANSNRKSTKRSKNKSEEIATNSTGNIKRLRLS